MMPVMDLSLKNKLLLLLLPLLTQIFLFVFSGAGELMFDNKSFQFLEILIFIFTIMLLKVRHFMCGLVSNIVLGEIV